MRIWVSAASAAAMAAMMPPVARAQGVAVATQQSVDGLGRRVGTLESQMRAVQRQVFPGGDKRFFQPENPPASAPAAPAAPPPGAAATAPLVDLTQRVDALERQQKALTGQIEELQFKSRQMEQALERFRGDAEFRLAALERRGAPAAETPPDGSAAAPAAASAAPRPPAATPPAATPPAAAARPTPASIRAAATPEEAEAQYRAAFARWTAKDYPAAAESLQAFVKANPKAARAGHAQFWAGRAMLEQGQTAQAAKAFLAGYQAYPANERAPNSLLWLGKSLIRLKQPKAACQALDQLAAAFPDRLTGQLGTDAKAAREEAKCQ